MPGTITLNIPLKPYLTKYLTKKYGETHLVAKKSWLGRYLIDLLDTKYTKSTVAFEKDHYYKVIIPSTIINSVGFNLSPLKIKSLSEMINKVFLNDLYSYIDVSVDSGLKFYNEEFDSENKQNMVRAIAQFLKFYDINEDELSPDSVYRNFHRNKNNDKTKSNKKKATV